MDILEKAGQLFLIGFKGTEIAHDRPLFKDLSDHNLGGVILFDKLLDCGLDSNNIESFSQLKNLTRSLQEIAQTPLFIGIDQEGGNVRRLKEDHGFPALPTAQVLGERNDPDYTYTVAKQTAAALAACGINLNFAPVVDLNLNPRNPIIGGISRSFSSDSELVTTHAKIWIEAFSEKSVISCIKHFPGHGSSRHDSHKGFVEITSSWQKEELLPYSRLIAEGVEMVMAGHLFNGQIDPNWPATLSSLTLTDLLRKQLGYEGIIVSDDMQMGAIINHYGMEEAICRALQAGCDLLIFGNNLIYDEYLFSSIRHAVKKGLAQGLISPQRIEESFLRIQHLKQKGVKEKNDTP